MAVKSISERITLNNNVKMPWFGLGVFLSREGREVEQAVRWALECGYRLIDTAAMYGNEKGVGKAIRESGIRRKEIFVTTKIWNSDMRSGRTIAAFEESFSRLDLEYVDLLLVHWPVEGFIHVWKDFETIYQSGRVKAIGVSNFLKHHLESLLSACQIPPAVNQIEFHPYLRQPELLQYCESKGIHIQAWSPLMQGRILRIPEIQRTAERVDKTKVQVVLRWDLQHGVATIPKSSNKDRIRSNADIFDFELSGEDMALLDGLDRNQRFGEHPDHFNF
ncbi:aldo/keto reductase [bacterium]|nr:aldo/keto reductase [bacterium]